MDQHTGGKWLTHSTKQSKDSQSQCSNSSADHPCWEYKPDTKKSQGNKFNPTFSKKARGQKHPWEVCPWYPPVTNLGYNNNVNSNNHFPVDIHVDCKWVFNSSEILTASNIYKINSEISLPIPSAMNIFVPGNGGMYVSEKSKNNNISQWMYLSEKSKKSNISQSRGFPCNLWLV